MVQSTISTIPTIGEKYKWYSTQNSKYKHSQNTTAPKAKHLAPETNSGRKTPQQPHKHTC
jgi:hypothetical protein